MGSWSANEWTSCFGFNDADFSDRVLRLEIVSASDNLKLKKIHVNSFILVSKSHFFYKLFKNGMRESQQRDEVALKINESEEAAFMELLTFIYDYSVKATSSVELVDVLMAADKFEVPSCVRYCVDQFLKQPMSTELALLCIELPSSVLVDKVVQTLLDSAKKYICAHHRNFTKSKVEAMNWPLRAVEILIGSNGLQVDSEDTVFDFILEWGRLHYPKLEERREILTKLVVNFVCLPEMSSLKLKEVMDSSDFDSEKVCMPVLDALFCKDENLCSVTPKYDYPIRDCNIDNGYEFNFCGDMYS